MRKSYFFSILFVALFSLISFNAEASCPGVSADFTISQTHTCGVPRNVTLTNTSTGPDRFISKYYWYMNGSLLDSTVGMVNIFRAITGPGFYSFKLIAKSPNDTCKDSVIVNINVTTNKPRFYDANFNPTYNPVYTNCITSLGSNVAYTMQTGLEDTIYNFTIKWGDGSSDTSGTKLNPATFITHTYANLGMYYIKIICTGGGCTDTLTATVINERTPSAGIIGPNVGFNQGCTPYTVRFVNNSYNTSGSTRFIWDWGDGTNDSLGPNTYADTIYHVYKKNAYQGTCDKTVTVTARNNCGQSTASWSSVHLYDNDVAKIGVADTVKCIPKAGSTFIFQNNSQLNCISGTRLYYWNFGDGSSTGWITQKLAQTHTYSQPGKYYVWLIDSNGCGSDTDTLRVYLTLSPIAGINLGNRVMCAPATLTFTDTVTTNMLLRTRQWDMADTSNGQARFDTSKTVTHTFYRAGVYNVRCKITNPCDTTSSGAIIEVYDKPVAKIVNTTGGCNPLVLSNINQSTGYSPYAHFFWDLGDGTTSTAVNPPSKSYPTGTYTIKLKIVDTCGTDSAKITFTVFSNIQVAYFNDTVCFGDTTHFNADSTRFLGTVVNDSVLTYYISDSVTTQFYGYTQFKHFGIKFTSPGIHYITFGAITYGGCANSVTRPVYVRESPSVSFSYVPPTNICDQTLITFFGNATTTAGTIASYHWDFGDGATSNSKDTMHRYAAPGFYVAKLTVMNSLGCVSFFKDTVKIRYNPQAKIRVNANCFGQNTGFIDSSKVLGGDSIVAWAWDYTGDGIYDAFTKNTSFNYPSAGNYKTILKVSSNRGCVAYDTAYFLIDSLPAPAFSPDTVSKCINQPFIFTNTTLRGVSYIWKWGDTTANTTVVGNSATQHTYTQSGTYTVTLYAFSGNSCLDSTSRVINVRPTPKALFSVNDTIACAPHLFSFNNLSTNTTNSAWYVNGTLVSNANTMPDTIVQMDNATLQIKLIAFNSNSCAPDTFLKTIRTYADPVASFTAFSLDSCNPFTVRFVNNSTSAVSYRWYFNDTSAIDTTKNPVHVFYNASNKDSVYNVRLIVYSVRGCDDTLIVPVHVRPKPTAAFSVSNTDSCGPFRVRFTNLSSPGDTESIYTMHFFWDFGNGITSAARDTAVQYVASNTVDTLYRIRLYAYSKHNCVDTISKTITVHPKAKASFTMTRSDSCGPLKVTFTNASSPGNNLSINTMTFRWNFGNGVTSFARDTSVTFIASATRDTVYTVQLVAFSNFGCADTITKQVIVYSKPKARFNLPDTARCGPAVVTMSNTSYPNDTGSVSNMTFFWNFGNGQTSTAFNPTATFTAAKRNDTVYTITLVAYSSHGCADTARRTYRVFPNPIDSFTGNLTGCSPHTVTFTNQTYNGKNYYWNFGDGTTDTAKNPVHVFYGRYLQDTVFNVKLVAQSLNGCTGDTFVRQVMVRSLPYAGFSATAMSGCTPLTTQFLNNSQGLVTDEWNFGDGSTSTLVNPTHTFVNNTNKDTTFNVRLVTITAYGCSDTIIKQVTVYPKPGANFTLSTSSGCGPLNVNFTNTSVNGNNLPVTAMTFRWDFGNGTTSNAINPSVTFAPASVNDTVYHVKLVSYSNHGCPDSIVKDVTVHPLPKAQFVMSSSDGCGPLPVTFTNTSSQGNGLPIANMTFRWDFGNGVVSAAKDTTIQFSPSLTKDTLYTIKLVAYSQFGCADSITKQVRVYPKPKSRFTASDTALCAGGLVTFNNTSYPNDTGSINIMSFYWDLGNGAHSTLRNPTTSYTGSKTQDTTYQVSLVAFSEHGCADTSYVTIKVHPVPVDSFSISNAVGCFKELVQFTNNSNSGVTFFWDFGDGSFDTAANPVHMYTNNTFAQQSFLVRMAAISAFGCTGDTVSRIVKLNPKPVADFSSTPTSGCRPLRVQFLNMSIAAISYLWDFDDGTTSTLINPVHYFYKDTTYTITLIATNSFGCNDTMRHTIVVKNYPKTAFTANILSGCTPHKVLFNNTTTGAVRYFWDFGDGYVDTAKNPQHEYNNLLNVNQSYTVVLVSFNDIGCSDTLKTTITVYPRPKANYNFYQPVSCTSSRIQFSDMSTNAFTYLWNFGDGKTDTARSPYHDYVNPLYNDTIYNATLIVTSQYGCTDTITKPILIRAIVHAYFKANPLKGCAPLTVNFFDSSFYAASLVWYFGDGFATTIQNPVHTYTTPGLYTVTLVAIAYSGCRDTLRRTDLIEVIEVPKADFIASPMQQAMPNNKVGFTNITTYTTACTFIWDFGDGSTATTKDASHTYTDTGTYNVKLTVTNGTCTDFIVKQIRIDPFIPVASFTVNVRSGCVELPVQFTNTSQYASRYEWEFGDGNTSTDFEPLHIYRNAGTYNVRLKAYGISGMDDTVMAQLITVYPLPVADFKAAPLTAYIPRADVSFANLTMGGYRYRWTFTNTNDHSVMTDTTANPLIHFTRQGVYTVKLVAYTIFGCVDSVTQLNYITVVADGAVHVPNVFSPNGDKINDIFIPVGFGIIEKDYHMKIYNRWGQLMFETEKPDVGWDGTYNGKPSDEDVYVYVIEGKFITEEFFRKKGTVTLLR